MEVCHDNYQYSFPDGNMKAGISVTKQNANVIKESLNKNSATFDIMFVLFI
jgi:hypothetical protein